MNNIAIYCDGIQAEGGTRTAAITGACIALIDGLKILQQKLNLIKNPWLGLIAAVSVGIYQGQVILDLDYAEDSQAETDMNIIMNDQGKLIEVQGTAEQGAFSHDQLLSLLDTAYAGIEILQQKQREILQ